LRFGLVEWLPILSIFSRVGRDSGSESREMLAIAGRDR
jgi:hypothetical protein